MNWIRESLLQSLGSISDLQSNGKSLRKQKRGSARVERSRHLLSISRNKTSTKPFNIDST